MIASRFPENRFGWLCCIAGIVWAVSGCATAYATWAFGIRDGEPFASYFALWLRGWLFYPAICLVVIFVPLLFPNGQLTTLRWRRLFRIAAFGTLCATLGFALEPTLDELPGLPLGSPIANPYMPGWTEWISNSLFVVGFVLTILAGIATGWSVVWRLRNLRGVERQQLKWIAYAGAIVGTIFAVNTTLFIFELRLADALWIVQLLSFALIPTAAGLAIFRYRLYDIDTLIRRTLIYSILSLGLVIAYLGLTLASGSILRTGFGQRSGFATAVSTLIVAALFRPLRAWVQSGVDRRFYRRRYDTARMVESFSERLRDEFDLPTLSGELHRVVQETMQPAHVSLWLRPPPATPRR
jgi:hypothetical protein